MANWDMFVCRFVCGNLWHDTFKRIGRTFKDFMPLQAGLIFMPCRFHAYIQVHFVNSPCFVWYFFADWDVFVCRFLCGISRFDRFECVSSRSRIHAWMPLLLYWLVPLHEACRFMPLLSYWLGKDFAFAGTRSKHIQNLVRYSLSELRQYPVFQISIFQGRSLPSSSCPMQWHLPQMYSHFWKTHDP